MATIQNPVSHIMRTLLIATGNAHKLGEIRELFDDPDTELLGFGDFDPPPPEVEETGATFAANAEIKALAYARHYNEWALADDSGIEVDALGGAPGVFSARFAGTHGDDAANNRRLLADMRGRADRAARFRCAIVIASPGGATHHVDGTVEGRIAESETGDHGFGYDPLFIPDGHRESFGVLPPGIKRAISHRARAVRAAAGLWRGLH